MRSGGSRVANTVDPVHGAWDSEQNVLVDGDEVVEYRVTMRVTFVVDDDEPKKGRRK